MIDLNLIPHTKSRRRLYAVQQGKCFYCDRKIDNLKDITVDHVKPKCNGHGLCNNAVIACQLCNNLKDNIKTIVKFRRKIIRDLISYFKRRIKGLFIKIKVSHEYYVEQMKSIIRKCGILIRLNIDFCNNINEFLKQIN